MIIAKIDDDRFLHLVRNAPLIAFQAVEFGYAVAAPGEAYYAPMDHPGGGNLPLEFGDELGKAFIKRACTPALRTLRPMAKPVPTQALISYLKSSFGGSVESMSNYDKAAGDHPAVIESECQIVILAIEENERPDLKDAMAPLKRDMMSNALDLVIEHAEAARELCGWGDDKPMLVRLHLLQASQAMKTALEMLLRP
jgi:hypothetical protein